LNLAHYDAKYAPNTAKQWLAYLRAYFPQAALLFERVKRLRDPAQLHAVLLAESPAAEADFKIPAMA